MNTDNFSSKHVEQSSWRETESSTDWRQNFRASICSLL